MGQPPIEVVYLTDLDLWNREKKYLMKNFIMDHTWTTVSSTELQLEEINHDTKGVECECMHAHIYMKSKVLFFLLIESAHLLNLRKHQHLGGQALVAALRCYSTNTCKHIPIKGKDVYKERTNGQIRKCVMLRWACESDIFFVFKPLLITSSCLRQHGTHYCKHPNYIEEAID